MKRIDPKQISGIVAHRWPKWRHHDYVAPGEWLLSTWYGDAETVWVKVPVDAEMCCYHEDIVEAFVLDVTDRQADDDFEEPEGWVCAVAFLGEPIEQRHSLRINGLDNG